MTRNKAFPRGWVEVQCNECRGFYEFWNHECGYEPSVSDRCPHCGACDYRRSFTATSVPMMWGINEEWERWHPMFRDPLNRPVREPISYSKAMAYATVHQRTTGEQVTAEDIMRETNTRFWGFSHANSDTTASDG